MTNAQLSVVDSKSQIFASIKESRRLGGYAQKGGDSVVDYSEWHKQFLSLATHAIPCDPLDASRWADYVQNQQLSAASRSSLETAQPNFRSMYESSARVVSIALDLVREHKVRMTKANMTNIFKCVVNLLFAMFDLPLRVPSLAGDANWQKQVQLRLAQMQELVGALNGRGKLREAYDAVYPIISAKYGNGGMDALTSAISGGGPEEAAFDFGSISIGPDRVGGDAAECQVVDSIKRELGGDNGFWEMEEAAWDAVNSGRGQSGLWGVLA